MNPRPLTSAEIDALQKQGCTSPAWSDVWVSDPFHAERFRNVAISGTVRLGSFTDHCPRPGGIQAPCGLYDSRIHHCMIEDNVYIARVQTLAHYHVHKNTVIENSVSIVVDGLTRFGNGAQLDTFNEGGGRTLPIFDRLSAQIAYMIVLYRHNPELIKQFYQLIEQYSESKASEMGTIEEHCSITNCRTITNVYFSSWAKVDGAAHLKNGTVVSCQADPTFIGDGVVAKNFIILSGSRVDDHVTLHSCFVGQSVRIENKYSAENSVFFANSECHRGEACAIFAGPYTVTHHKSTLLIAAMYSFYNAGSGSNQSNHMYKLGPIHSGILERGSKTGSSSYLMWPSVIGPFTAVIGKHYSKFDTSVFPFSYIFESDGESVILPSRNLLTVGTLRDSKKWITRDRRKTPDPLDLINFDLFSPYIIHRMIKGIAVLKNIRGTDSHLEEYVDYEGIKINRFRIEYSCANYEMAIQIFIGNCLMARLEALVSTFTLSQIQNLFPPDIPKELFEWRDLSGLIAPAFRIEAFIQSMVQGKIKNIESVLNALQDIHQQYKEDQWAWCSALLQKRLNSNPRTITAPQVIGLINDWKTSSLKLNQMVYKDCQKEFDDTAQIGYGFGGGEKERREDFEAVRGRIETNSFIRDLQQDSEKVTQRAETLIEQMRRSS